MSTPRSARPTPRDVAPRSREVEPESDGAYEDEQPEAREQRLEATNRHVPMDLCGEAVRVLPTGAWPMSAQRAIRGGDFDTFMREILHEDDYELYEELNPTLDEFNAFVEDAYERTGQAPGKSGGPSRSSRSTRRR